MPRRSRRVKNPVPPTRHGELYTYSERQVIRSKSSISRPPLYGPRRQARKPPSVRPRPCRRNRPSKGHREAILLRPTASDGATGAALRQAPSWALAAVIEGPAIIEGGDDDDRRRAGLDRPARRQAGPTSSRRNRPGRGSEGPPAERPAEGREDPAPAVADRNRTPARADSLELRRLCSFACRAKSGVNRRKQR